MTAKTTQTAILIMTLVMMTGFQNCSKVNFAPDEGPLGKLQSSGLEDNDFPVNEDLDPALLEDEAIEIADNDDNASGDSSDSSNCAKFAMSGAVDDSSAVSGGDVRIRKHRGSLTVSESQSLDLSNIRGSVYARTTDAEHLRNMRGSLCLVGESLGHLNNHRGNIEIIGAHSGVINNTRGTLVIDGGSVALIKNHRGDIILRNGAVVSEFKKIEGVITQEAATNLIASKR